MKYVFIFYFQQWRRLCDWVDMSVCAFKLDKLAKLITRRALNRAPTYTKVQQSPLITIN